MFEHIKTARGAAWLFGVVFLMFCNLASAEAGRVIFVSGEASLIRGGTLPLTKGTVLEAGDVLVTGPNGRVQMLMADGDRIALRPDTRFGIDDFHSNPSQPVVAGAPRPSGWRSFYSLIQGGFRTLTKTTGVRDDASYQVKTPVATIGIRGCDYSAFVCAGNCGTSPDGKPIKSALIVGVTEGNVNVRNQGGGVDLKNYQSTTITDPYTPPSKSDGIPPALTDSNPNYEGAGYKEEPGEGGGSTETAETDNGDPDSGQPDVSEPGGPAIQVVGTDANGDTQNLTGGGAPPTQRNAAYATGPVTGASAFTSTDAQPSSTYASDGAGRLTAFDSVYPSGPGVVPASYALGSSSSINDGFDSVTGLRWGRWCGGQATVTPQGQLPVPIDLTQQSLHWIYGPDGSPALPISGTLTYQLVGNTDPTDNHGNTGFLGSANFQANFTSQTVHSDINVGINGQAWNASGNGAIAPGGQFTGGYNTTVTGGSCGSGCSGTGGYSGFFTDQAQGAGMGYSMEQGGSTVSGTAAFGNPQ